MPRKEELINKKNKSQIFFYSYKNITDVNFIKDFL